MSLDKLAIRVLQRCEASGACEDPVPAPSPPRAGERVLEGVAWTGYADVAVGADGEMVVCSAPGSAALTHATAHKDHDPPPPGLTRWTLRCDHPGCTARVTSLARASADAKRLVVREAELAGWRVVAGEDLCPAHGEPYEAPRRELYPKGGQP